MRVVLCAALMLLFAAVAAANDSVLFTPADVAAIAGDGRLTLGVNHSGRLTTCRWPSPGFFEHVSYETKSRTEPMLGVEPWHGAAWALQFDGQLVWMYDDRWSHAIVSETDPRVIEIESAFAGRDLRVRQHITVHESGAAFESRITISGALDVPPTAFWYANLSPTTRIIPHLPVSTSTGADFAAVVDSERNTVVHFRPKDPASHQWRAARRLAEGDESYGDWQSFAPGCYAAIGTPNRVLAMTAGPEEGPASVVNQVNAVNLTAQSSASGRTASAIAMQVQSEESGYVARVITAFGATYTEAVGQFDNFKDGIAATAPEPEPATDVDWIRRHTLETIHTCTDAQTGSVVRSPSNVPALATDSPRHGVWIAAAWDKAGEHERAQRLFSFYTGHIRALDGGDSPLRNVPAALYTNGVEAAPRSIVDAAAAGRLLRAIDVHGTLLGLDGMQAFYRGAWAAVNDLAGFLALWRAPGATGPLYTFDYDAKRDRRTTELYVASYLGMRSAARIADSLSEPRPDWEQAANELRDAVRLHALHPDGTLAIDDPGALYDTHLIPEEDLFDWPSAVRQALQTTGGRFDTGSLERMCKLVLSARDLPQELRNDLANSVRRYLTRSTPDSAEAAFAYLIADKLHALEVSPPPPISAVSPDTP